jgi:hypothetical protein
MSSLLDLIKAKKQQLAAGNRRKTIKFSDGTRRYRILPGWRKGDEQFWHDFGQHYVKNAAGDMQAVYVCADKTFGKPCAVCDAIKSGIKVATDDATIETMKEALATGRVLVNAVALGEGGNPDEVQILEMPPSVFGQIVEIIGEWAEAGEQPLDPASGKDLLVTRTGTGKNTKYTVQVAAKGTKLSPALLTKLHNLDEYVAQESAEAEQRALNSVRSVAGLLPAPSRTAAAPRPSALPAGSEIVDDMEVAPRPGRKTEEFTDVPDFDAARGPAAAPAPAPAPSTASVSTGDDELDALLKELG